MVTEESTESKELPSESLKVMLHASQMKLVSTQNELNNALTELASLRLEVEGLTKQVELLQQEIEEKNKLLTQRKVTKSNPFAEVPSNVKSNPFAEVDPSAEEEFYQNEADVDHQYDHQEYEDQDDFQNRDNFDNLENHQKSIPITSETSKPPQLVQPKLVARASVRRHVSKPKRNSHSPVLVDEWNIPEETEQYYQQMFMAHRSGKGGVTNEWIYEELENEGMDEATTRDMYLFGSEIEYRFHLIPGNTSTKNETEFLVIMFLANVIIV